MDKNLSHSPIDVFELARALGLHPAPWTRPYGELREDEIRYPGLAPAHVQRAIIAMEIARAMLRTARRTLAMESKVTP